MPASSVQPRVRLRRDPSWVGWSDERILDLRFCDLRVSIYGTEIERRVNRLYRELESRGLTFRPHFWLSSEWFSPDGTPGIAVPFYLAHPRLARLERNQMLEVEGGPEWQFMRIARHETGHTLESAYRLHYRRRWQELFGSGAAPYPKYYSPKPYSKSFVIHLDSWYAQAHPSEDFAETFAVWLRPSSDWRRRYEGWPALRKLEYVDELMAEIAGEKPAVVSRAHIDPIRHLKQTLREHYAERKAHYGERIPDFYDRDLRRLFSDDRAYRGNPTAASFLVRMRPDLRKRVSRWTGEYQYIIDQVLTKMIRRCRVLKLRLVRSPERTRLDAVTMVTVQTMNYLHAGNHRVAL